MLRNRRANQNAETMPPGVIYGALVLGSSKDAVATISTITASVSCTDRRSFTVAGSVGVDEHTVQHWEEAIYPLVLGLGTSLGVDAPSFEIAITNLGLASSQNRQSLVSGYSLDVPVCLACISAMLNAPLASGLVATGHIASPHGDVRMVNSLVKKILAARTDQRIDHFIGPEFRNDSSLAVIPEGDLDGLYQAFSDASKVIDISATTTIAETITLAFRQQDILMTALENDYYSMSPPKDPLAKPLVDGLSELFWAVLEEEACARNHETVCGLLNARITHHIRNNAYPSTLGSQLHQFLFCLPRQVRRSQLRFPLVQSESSLSLLRLATANDLEDIRLFLNANAGTNLEVSNRHVEVPSRRSTAQFDPDIAAVVDEISFDNLHETIGRSYDEAHCQYFLESAVVESFEELLEVVSGLLLRIQRKSGEAPASLVAPDLTDRATTVLNEVYGRYGGAKTAFVNARDGVDGGVRGVLDHVTEYLKTKAQEQHVFAVLQRALNVEDYSKRLGLTSAIVSHLKPHLPDGTCDGPPEQYVKHLPQIVQVYVSSGNQMQRMFRAI